MPPPEVASLTQRAVLWPAAGVDAYGQVTVAAEPVEITVRWETKRQEVLDRQGNTVALDGVVVVRQDVAVGSRLWQGELCDWVGTGSGLSHDDEEIYEVKTYDQDPDIKGRAQFRQLGIMRLRARE